MREYILRVKTQGLLRVKTNTTAVQEGQRAGKARMPAEANERLIGECLCSADRWRKELRCARTECGGLRRREAEADDAVLMAVLSGNARK